VSRSTPKIFKEYIVKIIGTVGILVLELHYVSRSTPKFSKEYIAKIIGTVEILVT